MGDKVASDKPLKGFCSWPSGKAAQAGVESGVRLRLLARRPGKVAQEPHAPSFLRMTKLSSLSYFKSLGTKLAL